MKKRLKLTLFLLPVTLLMIWGMEEFLRRVIGGFGGSYPQVESWEIKASEEEIIAAIKELNKSNVNFQPPGKTKLLMERDTGYMWKTYEMQDYLKQHGGDSFAALPEKTYDNYFHDYWLLINLYYPDTREIVRAWTRPDWNPKKTTFAFVSLEKIDGPHEYKMINADFWYMENKRQIRKFETLIVNQIEKQLAIRKSNGK